MDAPPRANIVSSFMIKIGSLIGETYAVFAAWDFTQTKRENLDRLRAQNFIGASSAAWLRDVAKVLNRRFDPDGRDRPLITLAKHRCDLDEWRPLLLWHMTRDEFLLRDFLQSWLFPAFTSGTVRVNPDDMHAYLRNIQKRGGVIKHPWSEATIRRVAEGLLKIAADFGLLRGSINKQFASYQLPERSFVYLLHAIREERRNPGKVVAAPDWSMFLLRPGDVEHELLRLHQFRRLHFEAAGSLIQLTLPCATSAEYAEKMVA